MKKRLVLPGIVLFFVTCALDGQIAHDASVVVSSVPIVTVFLAIALTSSGLRGWANNKTCL